MSRSRKKPRQRARTTRSLHPGTIPTLNKQFYARSPHDYLLRKIIALAHVDADPGAAALAEQYTLGYQGLQIIPAEELEGSGKADVIRYLVCEAEATVHHVAEALLRLFLAHRGQSDCPWRDISDLRNFKQFDREVDRHVTSAPDRELDRDVVRVFFDAGPPFRKLATEPRLETMRDLLRRLARVRTEERHIFNAIKHGVAVSPSENAVLSLASEDPQGQPSGPWIQMAQGTAIDILERAEWGPQHHRWQLTTHWFEPRRSILLAFYGARAIGALWSVARHRYLGIEPSDLPQLPDVPLHELLGDRAGGAQRQRFSVNLSTDANGDRPLEMQISAAWPINNR